MDIPMQEHKYLYPHLIPQIKFKMDRPKCKSWNYFKKKHGSKSCDHKLGDDLLTTTPTAEAILKNDHLAFIKIKYFCMSKDTIRKVKA